MARLPSYRLHKATGQAVVTLSGKDHYLGKHGTPESREKYNRLLAQWIAGGRTPLRAAHAEGEAEGISINELILAYFRHCQVYYQKNGQPTSQVRLIQRSLKVLRKLYGTEPAASFGPSDLKAVRQVFIDEGLSRGVVNSQVGNIRRMFRWGAEEEMVPGSVYFDLKAVRNLVRGRCSAPDHPPVGPVPDDLVEATLPHVGASVQAMIGLQRMTGMRPGEVVIMRACDLDATGPVWKYVPSSHKTEHRGRERVVFLGPKAQEIVKPWLDKASQKGPETYLFFPKGHGSTRSDPRRTSSRIIRSHYTTGTYGQAIRKACMRHGLTVWSPNQLRHGVATKLRKQFGVDAAAVILGHSDPNVTLVYAEADLEKAMEIAEKVG